MNNIIKFDFKKENERLPYFHSKWMPALDERCENPIAWTYHVKFKIYKTEKNYAFQLYIGIGSEGLSYPKSFSKNNPVYNKDLSKIWTRAFNVLRQYNVDLKIVEEQIKQVKMKKSI